MKLPLPIALLRRRARNAKSPKERHDTAYFAWEASLRIAAASTKPPPGLDLGAPSVGHFVRWYRAPSGDPIDAPAVLEAYGLLVEVGTDRKPTPRAITGAKLVEALAAYRNKVLGHGSTRTNEFYQRSADVLLAGLDAAWTAGVFLPAGGELAWVEAIELQPSGGRRARIARLTGLASEIEDVDATAELLPNRIYVQISGAWTPLHPWLLFQSGELRERVLFFTGQHKGARFLDYLSGEEVKGKPLVDAFPDVNDAVAAALADTSTSDAAKPEAESADLFGGYRLLGKLGEGGMGVVYLAEQTGLGRIVALKMLPPSLSDDAIAVARFDREIAALSRSDHPNIIKILASGVEKGTHYYAMEFVDGVDLSRVAPELRAGSDYDQAIATASERLRKEKDDLFANLPAVSRSRAPAPTIAPRGSRELVIHFRDAALALQHLHDSGVIHRDVKPANLMITPDHRVVVMDLGLAAASDASKTLTRDASSILGTLRYMPPEQLQRNLLTVDHRVDVYSLGATFYELLTKRPFLEGETEAQLIEQILRRDPMPAKSANPALPRDLAVIIDKATRKEASERYASAGALAADLTAFLEGRPITARPATLRYVFGLFVRRNKALVAISSSLVVVLVGALAMLGIREVELRRLAQAREQETKRSEHEAWASLRRAVEESGRSDFLAGEHGRALWSLGSYYTPDIESPVQAELLARELESPPPRFVDGVHKAPVRLIVPSYGGARVATTGDDGAIAVIDAIKTKLLFKLDTHDGAAVKLAFSASGERLLSVHVNGAFHAWDVVHGKLVQSASNVRAAAWIDDDHVLVGGGFGAAVLDVVSGAHVRDLNGHTGGVAYVGRVLPEGFVTGDDQAARIWKSDGSLERSFAAGARVTGIDTTPDTITTADELGNVTIWDRTSGKALHKMQAGRPIRALGGLGSIAWRSDGAIRQWKITRSDAGAYTSELVASEGGIDAPVLDAHEGEALLQDRLGAVDPAAKARFELRSKVTAGIIRIANAGWALGTEDGGVAFYDRKPELAPFHGSWIEYFPFAVSPDSRYVAIGGTLIDAKNGAHLIGPDRVEASAEPAFVGHLVALPGAHELRVVDLTTASSLLTVPLADPPNTPMHRIALSSRFAALTDGPKIRVFALDGGAPIELTSSAPVGWLRFATPTTLVSCDRASVEHASTVGTCATWDLSTRIRLFELRGHEGGIFDAALSEDGKDLLTASSDGTARLWSIDSGREVMAFRGHVATVLRVAFGDRERKTVVTGSADGSAKRWDAATGKLEVSFDGHRGGVFALAVAPDGHRIATGDRTGTAIVWDARTGRPIEKLPVSANWLLSLAFLPNGDRLVGESADGTMKSFDVHLEHRSAEEVKRLIAERRLPWDCSSGEPRPLR